MRLTGKKVKCLETGVVYQSTNEAWRDTKVDPSNIKKSIKNGTKEGRALLTFIYTNELVVLNENFKNYHWINRSKTFDEVILANSLENLSVSHAKCNIILGDTMIISKILPIW